MEPGVGSDLGVVLTALMVGFGVGVVALDPRLDEAFGLALATVERDDFVARAVFLPAKEAVREGFVLVAIRCDQLALPSEISLSSSASLRLLSRSSITLPETSTFTRDSTGA